MGLEYGADDYVIKPFNPVELILRAKAVSYTHLDVYKRQEAGRTTSQG